MRRTLMSHRCIRNAATAALLVSTVAMAACGPGRPAAQTSPTPQSPRLSPSDSAAMAKAHTDSARHPYTQADIDFMSGMIAHHAQAIVMARWVPTHSASASIQTLAERIINAQQDEINIIEQWLRDRRLPVPDSSAHGMTMSGVEHRMLMPGMLTEQQMKQLDQSKGSEFDRLFLTFMIRHHKGAVAMVKDLFGTKGAAQDETIFKFASDVNVDQTTEVARMERMLVAQATSSSSGGSRSAVSTMSARAPSPDTRFGLRAGKWDAGEAMWNLRVVSKTRPSGKFAENTNSDLAFTGNYVIQGNYNGYQVWDISNPSQPTLKIGNYCPASQSDVSVYRNLLFVSTEGHTSRIDCGDKGVTDTVSKERLLGIRIFDITDITKPRNVANVQTCRGSHTHSLLVDPKDPDNVYVYISGSAPIRSPNELQGCVRATPAKDPNSALFRIEVIKVPMSHPERAAIVSSPRIFNDLVAVAIHRPATDDSIEIAEAKKHGEFIIDIMGEQWVLPPESSRVLLDSIVKARKGVGAPTSADSAALRSGLPAMIAVMLGQDPNDVGGPLPGPTQCHDITLFPGIGLAGGACGGYGLLIDIKDPVRPFRIGAVADSNFSYWHSATLNNDGTKILFSDEWGGGSLPKCRARDPREWGADAIFSIENGRMVFKSYYKLPAVQTPFENCVAHNGSLVPIPGRDIMVQAWYQGGITVFDWTDPSHPKEIAFFDRGPMDSTRLSFGGTWSAYWYNGEIVSSETGRGLDILELVPSAFISQNEIDAAKTIHLDYLNTQGQPMFVWPASFALARTYVDQLERSKALNGRKIAAIRHALASAEHTTGAARSGTLTKLAMQLDTDAYRSSDAAKVKKLADSVRRLAAS